MALASKRNHSGQGCLKRMKLADLTMKDIETYNQKVVLAGTHPVGRCARSRASA